MRNIAFLLALLSYTSHGRPVPAPDVPLQTLLAGQTDHDVTNVGKHYGLQRLARLFLALSAAAGVESPLSPSNASKPDFSGTWQLLHTENQLEMMDKLEPPFFIRAIAPLLMELAKNKVETVIKHDMELDQLTFEIKSPMGASTIVVTVGEEPFDIVDGSSGDEMRMDSLQWNGAVLVGKGVHKRTGTAFMSERYMEDGNMIERITLGDSSSSVVGRVVFQRK